VILIFYAFAREVRPFKRRLKRRSALGIAGLKGFRGWLGPTQVVGVATGIGMRRAERAAERALETIAAPALVVATGVSGALSEDLLGGDLVLADRIIAGGDAAAAPAAAITIPHEDIVHFSDALNRRGIRFSVGPVLSVARVLESAAAKRAAAASSGAIAVDMESAAVAAAAQRRGLRFACVRSIFDTIDEEVVGAQLAGPDGEVRPLAAAGFMLRNPSAALQLPGMLRNLKRAAASLATALDALASAV
jgi:adenosylhomocysteine nucleosidase